jgi:hypothetical protein
MAYAEYLTAWAGGNFTLGDYSRTDRHCSGDLLMYRKYINIVEAANKGCPIATHDLEVNVKNRQSGNRQTSLRSC